MATAVAQTPTDTASVTAQITSHIMLNPPNCTVTRDSRRMMFKICHDQAEISPVQRFSVRIKLPQIASRRHGNFDQHSLTDSCGDSSRAFRQREVNLGVCRRSHLFRVDCDCSRLQFVPGRRFFCQQNSFEHPGCIAPHRAGPQAIWLTRLQRRSPPKAAAAA